MNWIPIHDNSNKTPQNVQHGHCGIDSVHVILKSRKPAGIFEFVRPALSTLVTWTGRTVNTASWGNHN